MTPAEFGHGKIRVLVVDDSVVTRKVVSQALNGQPDIEVADTAINGAIALKKIPQINPDVITLDVEMPEMDGISTLKVIRRDYPSTRVIMCSSLTERGARTTMDALLLGAVDYVTKPRGSASDGLKQFLDDIAAKVRAHGRPFHTRNSPATVRPAANTSPAKAALKTSTIRALCIGSSTGGPNALADVFNSLRKPLTVPILIVQHMPAMFTAMLAERLSRCSVTIPCREAQHEEPILDGHAYVAPGGKHMEVRMQNGLPVVHLHQGPPENSCRPAVDVLFRSVAEAYRGEALGVVLTGMGSDGCRGSQALAARGGRILVQDEATSVVWGMPGSVVHANAADEVLPISQIGSHLSDLLQRYRPATLRRTEKPIEAHV